MRSLFRIKTVDEIITSHFAEVTIMGVTIYWHCTSRLRPVVPYELAIPEWKALVEKSVASDRQIADFNGVTAFIDQFFTEEEVVSVKDYLARWTSPSTVIEEIHLPIVCLDMPYSALSDIPSSNAAYGFVDLPPDHSYPFQFKLRGCFDRTYRTVDERYREIVINQFATRSQSVLLAGDEYCGAKSEATEDDLSRLLAALLKLKSTLSNLADPPCDPPTEQAA